VLADDGGGRAAMTASWLAQMGWEVAVLQPGRGGSAAGADPGVDPGADPGADAGADPAGDAVETGPWAPAWPALPELPLADPAQVDGWLRDGQAAVVDVDSSRQYLAGHVPGSAWALRTDLSGTGWRGFSRAGWPGRLVLTSADGTLARFAAADVPARPGTRVLVLQGGTAGWARSGRPLDSGPAEMLSPPVDVYRRPYEGTGVDPAAMQAYLDWEYGLVAQLERDGTHGFTVLT
jgi:rhodanese-related sulfurtransferase